MGVAAGISASGLAAIALLAAAVPGVAQAQAPSAKAASAAIYTCVDDRGRKLTSDRPIPECNAKEQRVLNKDGSVRQVRPPSLTADERAELDAAEARAAQAKAAQADAIRRDRNLKARFPNEAAHSRARESALDTVRVAMRNSEARLKELADERKPVMDEAEFYKGKPLPARLRQQLDANDAGVQAQRQAIANQQIELARINALYDQELARLKLLWSGAALGTVPAIVTGPSGQVSPASASSKP